jgi:hypothetical protein
MLLRRGTPVSPGFPYIGAGDDLAERGSLDPRVFLTKAIPPKVVFRDRGKALRPDVQKSTFS